MIQRNTIDSIFLPVKLVVLGYVKPPNNMGKIFSKISKWVYTKVKNFVSPILGLYYDGKKTVYQQPNTSPGESFVTSSRMEKMSDSFVELDSQLTGKNEEFYRLHPKLDLVNLDFHDGIEEQKTSI